MSHKPHRYTGIKYLFGSLVLAAALWFWGLFSGKTAEDLKGAAATTATQPDPMQPVIVTQPTQVAPLASNPTATLPSVNIPLNNQTNNQPAIQTIIIPGSSSSAPAPLTSTSSSH
jgi:hypothetical protein